MTTGSYTTGYEPTAANCPFSSRKYWVGGDGRTVGGRATKSDKQWNAYAMMHMRRSSGNSNELGYEYLGVPGVVTNHTFNLPYPTSVSPVYLQSEFNQLFTDREESALLSKLINKVRDHSLDLGVSLAEVDKLATTVSGTIKTLGFTVADLLTGNYARAARRLGTSPPSRTRVAALRATDISGRFLEMRYAWEPTLQDAFEVSKAFESISNGPKQMTFKKSRRKGSSITLTSNYLQGEGYIEARRTYTYEQYEEMSAFRSMGLTNPLTIVWERVPFSFVFDWFMPVGTYLSLIGIVPFMKGRWMRSDSVRIKASGVWTSVNSTMPTGWVAKPPFPDIDYETFRLVRSVNLLTPTVPRPSFKVEGAVQGKRLQNAIAIGHQLISAALKVPTTGKHRKTPKEGIEMDSFNETLDRLSRY